MIGLPLFFLYESKIAVLKRLSIFALNLVSPTAMEVNAFDIVVEYICISLSFKSLKSLNGVNGNGLSIGLRIAVRSVSNSSSHDEFTGSENSPL